MNVAMGAMAGATVLAIYLAAVLQYGGAVAATNHLTWILGLAVLGAAGGILGSSLL
ncbi:MAG: hypothetical protein SVU88_01250 [Candidatus Nanohaloarchaea archaeon]|nr:hypothetical protein [Candidatus Nanohaloarchaea archaeon]